MDFEESARRVLRDICHSQREPEIPAATAGILRSYQQEGVRWLASLAHYGLGGILADDMGLGKTLETIAFLASRKETDLPSLIVVPASVLYNWQEEFQRFAPDLRVGLVHGSREGRRSMLATKQGVDVLITTYQLLLRDIEAYEKWTFDCVVLDEAQYVKNSLAKVSQAVRRLHALFRYCGGALWLPPGFGSGVLHLCPFAFSAEPDCHPVAGRSGIAGLWRGHAAAAGAAPR